MTAVSGLLVRMKQIPWEKSDRLTAFPPHGSVTVQERLHYKPLCWLTAQQLFLWILHHWGKTQCMLGLHGTWPGPRGPSGMDHPHLKAARSDSGLIPSAPPKKTADGFTRKKKKLTDGDSAVRPHQVDIGLGDGSHTDLVIGSGEEGGERAGKRNCAVTGGTANSNSDLSEQEKTSRIQVRLFGKAKHGGAGKLLTWD